MEEAFLALLRDALWGKSPKAETAVLVKQCEDPKALLSLAEAHNVLPLVGPLFLEAAPDYADAQGLRQHIRRAVVRQIMGASALCQVTEALEQANIDYLVVKGAACRDLYPLPEQRPSTDEDIMVSTAQLAPAEQILLDLGYTRTTGSQADPVHTFVGPLLHVELHQALVEDETLEAQLEAQLQHPARFTLDGQEIRTLPPQAHFVYLAMHFYKHFLAGGVGIRQVADMVLMACSPEISWPEVWETLARLGLAQLVCGVMEIGEVHLGLEQNLARIPAAIRKKSPGPEPLLADILDAGVFGASTMERKHSSLMTIGAVKQGNEQGTLLRTLFPKAEQLAGRYSYLEKRPWLLPVAWTCRVAGYLKEGKAAGRRAAESAAIGRQRVALLKQYGLIRS